jgi:hypothetical protein
MEARARMIPTIHRVSGHQEVLAAPQIGGTSICGGGELQ